jgi:hypothetical protein
LVIGSTISCYKIVEKLGEGGMGVVYKAEDTKLNRQVALKFLAQHLLDDAEVKERFLREAQATTALHHANVCPVHEIDEVDGKTFLAMAFLKGETLEDRIAKGPLPIKDALDIARIGTQIGLGQGGVGWLYCLAAPLGRFGKHDVQGHLRSRPHPLTGLESDLRLQTDSHLSPGWRQ